MSDLQQIVLNNETGQTKVTDLEPAEVIKRLRVVITSLKGRFMNEDGSKVDYHNLAKSDEFKEYCSIAASLRFVDLASLSHDLLKAFYINVYNSLTVHAQVHQNSRAGEYKSTRDIPGFWKIHCYNLGGEVYCLDDLEHGCLRANKGHPSQNKPHFEEGDPRLRYVVTSLDPRIHFALNCGAKSCPPIRIYTEDKIDQQLELAAKAFLSQEVSMKTDADDDSCVTLTVSRLLQWYGSDFGSNEDDIIKWILQHSNIEMEPGKRYKMDFRNYDWAANDM